MSISAWLRLHHIPLSSSLLFLHPSFVRAGNFDHYPETTVRQYRDLSSVQFHPFSLRQTAVSLPYFKPGMNFSRILYLTTACIELNGLPQRQMFFFLLWYYLAPWNIYKRKISLPWQKMSWDFHSMCLEFRILGPDYLKVFATAQ